LDLLLTGAAGASSDEASDEANGGGSGVDAAALARIEAHAVRGELSQALQLAVDAQQWPHALLLASHVGADAYRSTAAMFAERGLAGGGPLRTLYLAMAGRAAALFQPGAPRAPLLARWRQSVATVLANRVAKAPALVATLGDQLWAGERRTRAAHVCYVVGELGFGDARDQRTRIVLLGADHKTRSRFAIADPGPEVNDHG
jgi:hypothetical protein